MSSSFRLECDLRVPILVTKNDICGRCEINPKPSNSGRYKHHSVVRSLVKHSDAKIPPRSARISIQSTELEMLSVFANEAQQVFAKIENPSESGENQDLFPLC